MAHDPLVVVQADSAIETPAPPVQRPAPSVAEQQVCDDLFTRDQEQLAATLLAAQAALAIGQHILAEAAPPKCAHEEPPRRRPPPGE